MSTSSERRVRVYHMPDSVAWHLLHCQGDRLPDHLLIPCPPPEVPRDCRVSHVHHDAYRRAFSFFLEHPSFDPVPAGEELPRAGLLTDAVLRVVELSPEARYTAALESIISDLREDMLSESAAYRRGVEDGVRQEGERVLGRIQEAIASWRKGDKETDRYAAYALEAIASCIAHRGITLDAALDRVRKGLGGCTCGQGNAAEPPAALPHKPGCPRGKG